MILEDLFTRLEGANLDRVSIYPNSMGNWECQLDARRGDELGFGSGPTLSEALEGALDDMERGAA